jgi:hypothetical protein
MFSQGIIARKLNKKTIELIHNKGFDESNELIKTNAVQIIFLYKLKYNYLHSKKKYTGALYNGLIIAIQLKDFKFPIKLFSDFILNRMKPIH